MTDQSPTILVIDDVPANLMALGAALGDAFDLQIATSGEAGLALAEARVPDLILLDVMMPGIDGYETFQRLLANPRLRTVPVIFLTALQGFESESFGLALGAADYITKPINVEIARQRICNLLEREQLRRQVESQRDQLEHAVRQRTAQLQDRMEELQSIYTLSPDGFVSFDHGKRVSQVSPSFSSLTGLTAASVTGMDAETFTATLDGLCIGTGRGLGSQKAAALMKLDAEKTASADWLTIALKVPVGRTLQVTLRQCSSASVSQILYLRDVTRETEIDRMKFQFLELVAHELRTPLTAVQGYTEILLAQNFGEAEHRELLGIVHQQSTRVTSIANDVLDLVQIDSLQGQNFVLEPLLLQQQVENAVAAYTCEPARDAPVLGAPARTLRVTADRKKLAQVLANLISNAYTYSPDGGEVRIDYVVEQREGVPWCGVVVRDRGLGMTAEQLAHCFERFYRADRSGKVPGTGLGLCIVKEIIDLHCGHIEIQSTPGEGTVITVWLAEYTALETTA